MLAWMVDIARKAGLGPVLVAASEPEAAAAAQAAGAQVQMTDPNLPSGTDRIHAAIEAAGLDADIIVNLQGDMPTMKPEDVAIAANLLDVAPEADIATLVSPSLDQAERANSNLVKCVAALADDGKRGRALYFTRADAPWGEGPVLRHVGIYAYRRAALRRFVAAPPSPLERREKLEQLRALEMGMRIEVELVADFPKGVDSPPDLEAARQALRP